MAEAHGGDEEPRLRVGDAERRAAMQALDAHLEAGRLPVEEYGDRSAAAVTAQYRDDLAALFVDLPAPHPPLPRRPGEPVAAVAAPVAGVVVPAGHRHGPAHPAAGLGLGLAIMLLCAVPAIVGALVAGAVPVGGFVLFPLLFLALGGLAHHRHGGDGRHER